MYYAFDADDEDDRDDPIHIVYASDFHSIAGVEASIRSVQAHASAPHRVKFYFIGDDPLASLPEVQYINLTDAAIMYNVEEFTNPNYERKGKHKREEGVKTQYQCRQLRPLRYGQAPSAFRLQGHVD